MHHRHMTTLKFFSVSVLGYFFMMLAQYYYIYNYLIVQRLPTVSPIPSIWYFGWMMPTMIMILAVGYWSENIGEVIGISFLLGVVNSLEMYFLYMFDKYRYMQLFDEGHPESVYEVILVRFLILIVPILLVFLSRKILEHFIDEVEEEIWEELCH